MEYTDDVVATRLEISADTSDWAAKWTGSNGVAKSFYVAAYTDDDTPVSGVAISLASDSEIKGDLLGSPVTNNSGVATCRVLFASYDVNESGYVTFSASGSGSLTEDTTIVFVEEVLPKVRCALALDGVIDDNDYASNELTATLSGLDGSIDEYDSARLFWGQTSVPPSAILANSYFEFDLNGRDDLFQNQVLRYRGMIITPSGNGSYSPAATVSIERENGGEGLKYLTGLVSIPEAASTGYINRGMAAVGVTVLIENGNIEDENGVLIVEDYLHNSACTVILNMTGKDSEENIVNHLRYNVSLDPDKIEENETGGSIAIPVKKIVTTDGTTAGASFFTNLGEGRVYLNLTVTYTQTPYSLRETIIKSYRVDVIPPGV